MQNIPARLLEKAFETASSNAPTLKLFTDIFWNNLTKTQKLKATLILKQNIIVKGLWAFDAGLLSYFLKDHAPSLFSNGTAP